MNRKLIISTYNQNLKKHFLLTLFTGCMLFVCFLNLVVIKDKEVHFCFSCKQKKLSFNELIEVFQHEREKNTCICLYRPENIDLNIVLYQFENTFYGFSREKWGKWVIKPMSPSSLTTQEAKIIKQAFLTTKKRLSKYSLETLCSTYKNEMIINKNNFDIGETNYFNDSLSNYNYILFSKEKHEGKGIYSKRYLFTEEWGGYFLK